MFLNSAIFNSIFNPILDLSRQEFIRIERRAKGVKVDGPKYESERAEKYRERSNLTNVLF